MTTPTVDTELAIQIGRIEGRREQGLKRLEDTNQLVRDLSKRIDNLDKRVDRLLYAVIGLCGGVIILLVKDFLGW